MSKTAADIMEKNVITAQKDTSIFNLVDMFVENNVNAIPIVQDDKEIIGIVTDADLLYKEVKPCVPQYVTSWAPTSITATSRNTNKASRNSSPAQPNSS